MKVVFGTVVYKAALKFKEEFIQTINQQDTLAFDVFILNDNLEEEEVSCLVQEINREVVSIKGKENSSVPELRIQLIEECKKLGYDLLVLGDFDDTISENRISSVISNFDSEYTFFYNELYYMNTNTKFFNSLPNTIQDITPILECNFLGLSNTAINLRNLDMDLITTLKFKQTQTFDWMLYSVLLLQGHKGKKIFCGYTNYRIYDQNIAGETKVTRENLLKEVSLKTEHYYMLKDLDIRYYDLYDFYNNIQSSFEEYLLEDLSLSPNIEGYWWGNLNQRNIKGE